MTAISDRLREWAQKNQAILFQAFVLAALGLALLLRAQYVAATPQRSPDERLYTGWAQQLVQSGLGAYPGIFARYAADPSQWIYPSPTRVLHVLGFAGMMKLTGSDSAQAGAAVSFLCAVGSVLLVAWLGGRFFNRFVGALAALFLATFVVELEFARRAWGESTTSFVCLLSLAAAFRLAEAPERFCHRVQFALAGAACLLAKETAMLAHGLYLAWLISDRLAARDVRSVRGLLLGGLWSLVGAFAVLTLLAGDWRLVIEGWRHVFGSGLGSNEWGALHASGPWYQFARLLWVLAPFTASMAMLGGLAALRLPETALAGLPPGADSRARLLLLTSVAFIAACAFGPNLQYLRIMAPANPAYCLLAALGARSVLTAADNWGRGRTYPALLLALPAALALGTLRDYGLYRDVVVGSGMQDMTARWVLDGARRRAAGALVTQRALAVRPPARVQTQTTPAKPIAGPVQPGHAASDDAATRVAPDSAPANMPAGGASGQL